VACHIARRLSFAERQSGAAYRLTAHTDPGDGARRLVVKHHILFGETRR
jgi:hypothetical protein